MATKPAAAETAQAPAKSKKMLIIIVAVVLLLVLGGGAFLFISKQRAAAAAADEGEPFTAGDIEGDPAQHLDPVLFEAEMTMQVEGLKHGLGRGGGGDAGGGNGAGGHDQFSSCRARAGDRAEA